MRIGRDFLSERLYGKKVIKSETTLVIVEPILSSNLFEVFKSVHEVTGSYYMDLYTLFAFLEAEDQNLFS